MGSLQTSIAIRSRLRFRNRASSLYPSERSRRAASSSDSPLINDGRADGKLLIGEVCGAIRAMSLLQLSGYPDGKIHGDRRRPSATINIFS